MSGSLESYGPDEKRLRKRVPEAMAGSLSAERDRKAVSRDDTNSHNAAVETPMSESLESYGPDETRLRERVPEAMAGSLSAERERKAVSFLDTNSHDLAFETQMSEPLESQGSNETGLRKRILQAMARSPRPSWPAKHAAGEGKRLAVTGAFGRLAAPKREIYPRRLT